MHARPLPPNKLSLCRTFLAVSLLFSLGAAFPVAAQVNVTQHHNHLSRDGLYVDPAFTANAAANLKRDLNFNGAIPGNVYAQPLYIEGGPGGQALVIAATESNYVCALDPASGNIIWQQQVGAPVPLADLQCGNIDPVGITGTPAVDLPSRSLFFDAMTTPDGGTTKQHLIYSLNVDTGAVKSGWPVDVNTAAVSFTTHFTSASQNERGALAVIGANVYVPYGGDHQDCGTYYGWVVGVPLNNPAGAFSWATSATGGGAWSVGGIASDGTTPFLATGNTYFASSWSGGEAIIHFPANLSFNFAASSYWAPVNWQTLDNEDFDLGGSGPLLVNVPGASPSNLVVALGKDGYAYLLNRNNLGGVSAPLASAQVSSPPIIQAAVTYQTAMGTYVAFAGNGGQLNAFRITPTSPPTIVSVWSAPENGRGSPFVTSTDGTNNVVVWGIGSENDQRLHGFDGDTGATVFSGGGANELMANTRRFNTGIAARGRIYVANDGQVCAFTVPVSPIVLSNLTASRGGSFALNFTNVPGMNFSIYSTADPSQPFKNWIRRGTAAEISSGQFRYTEPFGVTNAPQYYRVASP